MEIYKIIAEKVCNAICHEKYQIVDQQAKMKDEDTFTFMLGSDEEVTVDFWSYKYIIYIDGKYLLQEEWDPTMTVKGIADDIIDDLKYR